MIRPPKAAFLLAFLLFVLVQPVIIWAQEQYAASLQVFSVGVEVRRAGTGTWLPLISEALSPLGTGDAVRTDDRGRAYLSMLDTLEILVLPNSMLQIEQLETPAEARLSLAAQLEGHMVQRLQDAAAIASYHLETNDFSVTRPALHFALWSGFEESSVVTVFQGEAEISSDDMTSVVRANQGLRVESRSLLSLRYAPPLNAARLIGLLEGCKAQVRTGGDLRVNIRNGSGFGYDIIESRPNRAEVTLLGRNQDETWYRVQLLSGFGWVRSMLVDHQCTDLTLLPRINLEQNMRLYYVNPSELALLAPFYGSPANDWWFFRTLRP